MSDDSLLDARFERIEAALAAIQATMAAKADLADMATRADLANMATKADLANMATKADLADMAKNIDVEALGRLVRQSLTETGALRDELRVVSALANSWSDRSAASPTSCGRLSTSKPAPSTACGRSKNTSADRRSADECRRSRRQCRARNQQHRRHHQRGDREHRRAPIAAALACAA